MNDMAQVIIPRSDQWNYDDFLAGPITFKIVSVRVKGGQEQPVEISMEGTEKFYRPCKSMSRCMVAAWGADSSKYAGRSFTLYGDPSIKWGGMAVGGIRISHMTDIAEPMTMALTATKGSRKAYTVKPLVAETAAKEPTISEEQALTIDAACAERGVRVEDFKAFAGIELVIDLPAKHYKRALAWIDKQAASAKAE